ncbi:MAG: flagellar brake protein [Candidatus Aquicultor sp.]
MALQDKTIICKAVERPIMHGCDVGGLLTVVRPTDDGSCAMPVKVAAIGDKAEIIAIIPIGKPQRIQRRAFPRIRTDSGIQVKLQFDNQVNRYKGLKVYDVSGGGIGVTIYSRNPIEAGHRTRLEIELNSLKSNKIRVRGEVVHCSSKSPGATEYLLGIKFTEIDQRDQHKIIEFVAGEQRRQEEQDQHQKHLDEQRAVAEEKLKQANDKQPKQGQAGRAQQGQINKPQQAEADKPGTESDKPEAEATPQPPATAKSA